jgi:hypothetical protein
MFEAIRHWIWIPIAASLLLFPSCGWRAAYLRVHNESSVPLRQFSVCFPQEEIKFGDIAPGEISSYRRVPNGVGRWAAFRFSMNGNLTTQAVEDFVGWEPIKGEAFTYRVQLDTARRPLVRIIDVIRDR